MIKAVFLDYTGTITQEGGQDAEEMIRRLYLNSDIESPQAMLQYWWKLVKKFEAESYKETYLTGDEIALAVLEVCRQELNLKDNLEEIHKLCQRFWIYAPAFDDVEPFFKKCPYPIYVLTNNAVEYVEEGMRHKMLHPAGIISGDMVRAYKPHEELFEKALEISGCKPNEVIHIGDSVSADVLGAAKVGITPILLDRTKKKECKDCIVVHTLVEALEHLQNLSVSL